MSATRSLRWWGEEPANRPATSAEAIEVEIEELPAVVHYEGGRSDGRPRCTDDLTSNLCL